MMKRPHFIVFHQQWVLLYFSHFNHMVWCNRSLICNCEECD